MEIEEWKSRCTLLDRALALRSDPQPVADRLGSAFDATVCMSNLRERTPEVVSFRGLERNKVYPTKEYGWPANKKRGRARGRRSWARTTAIMIHTTGVRGMHVRRFLGCPCHIGIAEDGRVALCHPLDSIVWHGHAANRFSIGIEVAGVCDFDDKRPQLVAARGAIEYCVRMRESGLRADRAAGKVSARDEARYGGSMCIMAHRQSHSSRVRDPGAALWRELGEWAIDTLGLRLGPVVGSGTQIPADWWSAGRAPEK